MSRTRISRAIYVGLRCYQAPGGASVHRAFDTATADGSLIEVGFTRAPKGSVYLTNPSAGDVWVEHDDTTVAISSLEIVAADHARRLGELGTIPGGREISLHPGESFTLPDGTVVRSVAPAPTE